MASIAELVLADFDQEMSATRRVLERLPDDRFSWKPHEKSTSLGDLGSHVADMVGALIPILRQPELDFAAAPQAGPARDSAELLARFDGNLAAAREALQSFGEGDFAADWTFRVGDHVVFTSPRLVTVRSFVLSHVAHHRGQLTVYLRLLDVPVPSVYGPTADEN